MDKLARLMERNGIDSLRRPTQDERLAEVEAVSDMAYINSELALAMLEGLEV